MAEILDIKNYKYICNGKECKVAPYCDYRVFDEEKAGTLIYHRHVVSSIGCVNQTVKDLKAKIEADEKLISEIKSVLDEMESKNGRTRYHNS